MGELKRKVEEVIFFVLQGVRIEMNILQTSSCFFWMYLTYSKEKKVDFKRLFEETGQNALFKKNLNFFKSKSFSVKKCFSHTL